MAKWNGKKKAVTFSFDDGLREDAKLIEIFDRLGLKGTFNIPSGVLLEGHPLNDPKENFSFSEIRDAYAGHEVAGHTLDHPRLSKLADEEIIRQVEEDRLVLSEACGYEVVGFAYPYGDCDGRVAKLIKEHTGIRYGRLVERPRTPFAFLGQDPITYLPSLYIGDKDFEETVRAFLSVNESEPRLLCIWGHARDFGAKTGVSWELFEQRCRQLSGREDVFYGTNREVFL